MEIDVEEVSLVGKAANGRRFLIVKQEEGSMDPDVKKAKDGGGEKPEATPTPQPVAKEATPAPAEKPPEQPTPAAPVKEGEKPTETPAPQPAPAEAPAAPEKIEKQEGQITGYGDAIPKLIAAVQDVIGTLMEALKAVGYGYSKGKEASGFKPETLAAEIQKASESLKGIQERMAKVSKGEDPDAKPAAPAPSGGQSELKDTLEKIQKSLDGIDNRLKAVEGTPRQVSKGDGDGGAAPVEKQESIFKGLV